MTNFKGLLREVDAGIEEAERSLNAEYRALGEELLNGEASGTAALKEGRTRAQETADLLASEQASAERLQTLLTQLSETRQAVEEKQGEVGFLREELEPHYEAVGRAAVDALADDEGEAAPYRKLLDQLRGIEGEVKQIDRDIHGTGRVQEQPGIVTQALAGGRRLYLQGVARSKLARAVALYRRLGREVCESDLITRLDSRAFLEVLEPVVKNRDQMQKVDAQLTSLRNKQERLESEISGLCEGERPQRHLQRFEEQQKKTEGILELQLRDLGAQFAERSAPSSLPKAIKAALADVKKAQKELAALSKRRDRIEAAIAVQELDKRVETNRSRVRSLEATVKKANREISTLSSEISDLTAERERLEGVRGPIEELVGETIEEVVEEA